MNITITEDDRMLSDALNRFCHEVIAPAAARLDEEGLSATMHRESLSNIGIMGMNLPEAYGGTGISAVALYLAVEHLAGACGSTASMVTAHFLSTDSILLGGTEEQKATYLPDAAAGRKLGAFALTEPCAGSNPAGMRTVAEKTENGYRLRGVKHFISNAGEADFLVVYAKTDKNAGHRGISAFIVDRETAGIEMGPAERTMGLRGGHVYEVALDCEVSTASLLGGEEGTGFRTAMKVLDNGRVEIAASCTGIARAAYEASLSWAQTREVDDHPIGDFQGLQWMIADMTTDLEAARMFGLRAATRREEGARFSLESAMAKLYASESAARITDKALQIHGGYGYSRELPLERYVRDVRIMRIYEGSSEVQRNIIARTVLSA
ncbi:MAG: alkylation response protein AidB-like acyl-CoA dehydrogenase [Motiliproteus sp.]|jgi:alkylation response protein AidB-like acyl-CoA dehydrogenase